MIHEGSSIAPAGSLLQTWRTIRAGLEVPDPLQHLQKPLHNLFHKLLSTALLQAGYIQLLSRDLISSPTGLVTCLNSFPLCQCHPSAQRTLLLTLLEPFWPLAAILVGGQAA